MCLYNEVLYNEVWKRFVPVAMASHETRLPRAGDHESTGTGTGVQFVGDALCRWRASDGVHEWFDRDLEEARKFSTRRRTLA